MNNTLFIGPNNQENIDRLSRDKQTLGTLKHYPPAIKEWNNSIYTFHPNNSLKLLPSIDKSVYNILKGYFNLNPTLTYDTKHSISKRLKRFSMIKLFIGKPEIKHSNNKVIITIYTYNRKKIYFLNKIKKIMNIYAIRVNKFRFNKSNTKFKLTKIKDSKSRLSLIQIKDFKSRLSLIQIKDSKSRLSLNKIKYPSASDKFIGLAPLKNKKILYHELRLLKKKLKKINRFIFNVLKNKSISFLFIYLKKKYLFYLFI